MVRNHEGVGTREMVVPQSIPQIRMSIRNIIHGHLDKYKDVKRGGPARPATLIVVEFHIQHNSAYQRVRRAEITVSFATLPGDDPSINQEVYRIAPNGGYLLLPDEDHPGQFKLARKDSYADHQDEIAMSGFVNFSAHAQVTNNDLENAATWQINENKKTKVGIPNLIQTALLLRPPSDEGRLEMELHTKLITSGFSFEPAARFNLLSNETISFDPNLQFPTLDGVNSQNLDNVDLAMFFKAVFTRQDSITATGDTEQQRQGAIQTALGAIAHKEAKKQSRSPRPPSAKLDEKIQPGEYFYAELWSRDSTRAPITNRTVAVSGSKFDPEIKALDKTVLEKYFSWVHEDPPLPSTDRDSAMQPEPKMKNICSLIGRQGETAGCQNLNDLNALFSKQTWLSLTEFFQLPTEFSSFRGHDSGIWLRAISSQGQDLAYFYQTPFYPEKFWSLVLFIRGNSTNGAAVLQSDSKIDCQGVLQRAKEYGSRGSHPLIVLVLLFQDHVLGTADKFKDVSTKIQAIDADLLAELKAAQGHKTKLRVSEYGTLSHRIYEARMELVELQRRREFEAQVGKTLKNDVKEETSLITRVDMFTGLSASHELGIQNFPDRIESQRTVLYSLIAQQDARVQFKLARETTKDSKAMKTLAVITILLLPGTFMATLFAVPDLITLKPRAKVQIYCGVTVPATFVLIVCWWLWVRRSASHVPGEDEEATREKAKWL
ncbi:hypothetical protein NA57DRAFT_79923 [Rhizodiscina lignyota]|uniref:Uncharacterized protein n=1 Tax=Rhizodiscina lignyota TaxID=1504668 RepID=A0A9P4I8P7_9PEZI|nr:hypothetical protein NA57DRAFT_79923 [Rhizodiscina lignyota]